MIPLVLILFSPLTRHVQFSNHKDESILPLGIVFDIKSPLSSSCAASIPFFACELKAVSPYRRGFMCGDPSITYPYLHQEAISDELLIAGGIIITGLTVSTQ